MLGLFTAALASTVTLNAPEARWFDEVAPAFWLRRSSGDLAVHRTDQGLVIVRGAQGDYAAIVPREGPAAVPFAGDVDGDGDDELLFAHTLVEAHDPLTGDRLSRAPVSALGGVRSVQAANLDGIGPDEWILHHQTGRIEVYDVAGTVQWWTAALASVHAPVVLQADTDAELELAIGEEIHDVFGRPGVTTPPDLLPGAQVVAAGRIDWGTVDDFVVREGDRVAVYTGYPPQRGQTLPADGVSLYDVDGDGREDVVLTDTARSELRAVDGITGYPLGTWPLDVPPCCDGWSTVSPTPGSSWLALDGRLFDATRLVSMSSDGPAGLPVAVDLDGDGTTELLWSSATGLRVTGPFGRPLRGHLPGGRRAYVTLHDVDLDGDEDLVTTDDGLRRWQWSRARGFTDLGEVIPGLPAVREPRLGDATGDGVPELFGQFPDDLIRRVDLATGVAEDLRWHAPWYDPVGLGVRDLDGDGLVELVVAANQAVSVYRPNLSSTATPSGHRFSLLPDPVGLVVHDDLQSVRLLLEPNGSFLPQESVAHPAGWAGASHGRVWFVDRDRLVGVDVHTGDRLELDTPLVPDAPPVLLHGQLWLTSGPVVERWRLP
jgi:hypothetical protein